MLQMSQMLLWKRFILQFPAKKNFPPEYFLAADRRDIYIIKGDKNLIAFISLLLIQKKCIQKIIFLKKVWLRVDFQSQFLVQVPSHASVNKLCRQKLCKFVVHLVTSNWRFCVSKEQKCSFHLRQLFIWKIFVKSENNTMWSINFNQQTPTVSVLGIYLIETHSSSFVYSQIKWSEVSIGKNVTSPLQVVVATKAWFCIRS